jgi:hypothetical protein
MEIIIALVIVAIAVALYFNRKSPSLDVNKDGNVDVKDVVAAAVKVEEAVVAEVKEVVTKVKAAAKKPVAKKVAAKKPAAKKTTTSKKV